MDVVYLILIVVLVATMLGMSYGISRLGAKVQ
jgi:hypothetical protein